MLQRNVPWVNEIESSFFLSNSLIFVFISPSLQLFSLRIFLAFRLTKILVFFCVRSIAHPGREIGYLN